MDISWILPLLPLAILRLLVPLAIFKWPLGGFLMAMLADTVDFIFMPHQTQEEVAFYNQWDKFFDVYFLVIALYQTRQWQDVLAKKWGLFLFLYRMVGVIAFELTQLRYLLFIFPNLFDYFYLFYTINKMLINKHKVFLSSYALYIILVLLLIPKLIQEFFIHVVKQMPWQLTTIPFLGEAGSQDTLINQGLWLLLYDLLLISILMFKLHIDDDKGKAYKNLCNYLGGCKTAIWVWMLKLSKGGER